MASTSVVTRAPESLTAIARKKINTSIRWESDVKKLELPRVLEDYCHDHYYRDRRGGFWKVTYAHFVSVENVRFDDPFLEFTTDQALTLQSKEVVEKAICIPWVFIIRYHWYSFSSREGELIYDKICHDCYVHCPNKKKYSIKYHWDSWCTWASHFFDEVLSVQSSWCSLCDRRTLFAVHDYDSLVAEEKWSEGFRTLN